jgi:F-type H+-transporting ATPase subunit delta
MSEKRVAIRYATSILTLAKERGVLDEVYQDMENFEKICDENPELVAVLKNPIIYSYKKLAILKQLLSGKFHSLTISFFEIIARKNREEALPAIAKEFEALYEADKNIARATVTTTFPLSEGLRSKFIEIIGKAVGKNIKLQEKVNPNLIGGFIVTIGDRQIDTSIFGKLQKLKMQLA